MDQRKEKASGEVSLPSVFLSPIRTDVVHIVHTNMSKNKRQPYAVSEKAGHQHSAESWGTGRAVARIPRVSGGGTSRSGQGAFGNMCRKGRMFAPTKTWRRWHRKINQNQKRFAVCSALAATAVPALVMARGHRISRVPQIPLVVDDSAEALKKTRDARQFLDNIAAMGDVEKSKNSRHLRAGKGKYRNRRYVQRLGPLFIYGENSECERALRNLPGVDVCSVDRLNLLQLAPGGHIGRFCIWTKSAFEKLNQIYGNAKDAVGNKSGFTLPRPTMTNADLDRIIKDSNVQASLRPAVRPKRLIRLKKNPLKNLNVRIRLNPYYKTLVRQQLNTEARAKTVEKKRKMKITPKQRQARSAALDAMLNA